jgi:soluble lytic murein transglycosylase-like protein
VEAVKRLAAALCLALAVPAAGQGVEHWSAQIEEASARFGVPQEWIRRVMQVESGGHTFLDGRPVTSRAGAIGLMQLMPGTWAEMRQAYGLGPDPYAPRDNILAGAAYLRLMYDRFGYPGLFAAYNAGPVRYAEHLATGAALPAETVAYLRKASGPSAAAPRTAAVGVSTIFVLRRQPPPSSSERGPVAGEALFAVRSQTADGIERR